jgi:hypothetical protein
MIRNLVVTVVAVAFALIPVSPAMADIKSDTGPGCGLGKLLWGEAAQTGHGKIVQQVLAATTNGTFGSQTFGITTGTSGCTNDGLVKNDQKVIVFASANFESLKQEMAQGGGEYLSSLATLMDIPAENQGEFFTLTQDKYTTLVKSETTTPDEMLVSLNQELSAHPVLSQVMVQ